MNWLTSLYQNLLNKQEDNTPLSEEMLLELEERLLRLDCGIEFADYLLQKLSEYRATTSNVEEKILNICQKVLQKIHSPFRLSKGKQIIMLIGVNGSGKTTSLGKLAHYLQSRKRKVLISACDTFRAAAGSQLEQWAQRANAKIDLPISANQRPDSLLYQSLEHLKTGDFDTLLVDTAGRLQNKTTLMAELGKFSKVLNKHSSSPDIKIERYLVLDASNGQNAYSQAKLFNEVAEVSGIILSKFDGSAKGGTVLAIAHNLQIPVKFLGQGEKIEDLKEFEVKFFLERFLSQN